MKNFSFLLLAITQITLLSSTLNASVYKKTLAEECSVFFTPPLSIEGVDAVTCFHNAKHYYFDERCYRKAMYWAFKGAELGSSECMYILRHAYGNGNGVIQDDEECLKWLLIASCMGNQEAKQDIKKCKEAERVCRLVLEEHASLPILEDSKATWNKAKKRAQNWVENHQNLFISQH